MNIPKYDDGVTHHLQLSPPAKPHPDITIDNINNNAIPNMNQHNHATVGLLNASLPSFDCNKLPKYNNKMINTTSIKLIICN